MIGAFFLNSPCLLKTLIHTLFCVLCFPLVQELVIVGDCADGPSHGALESFHSGWSRTRVYDPHLNSLPIALSGVEIQLL